MANNSVDNLSYKLHISPAASSTNHKEDIIKARLHELKIAYCIMASHPEILNEFKNAVKMGANPPTAEEPRCIHQSSLIKI
jgi:hypothetical protein